MVLTDAQGLPLATEVEAASVAEVNLIEPLLDEAVTRHVPARLVYDKAADCDALRDRLAQRGVDLICPHRKNRVRQKKQDGRKLRRYRRRWTIERSIAWLQALKRLVVRNEFYAHLYHGFVQLACMIICFRRL